MSRLEKSAMSESTCTPVAYPLVLTAGRACSSAPEQGAFPEGYQLERTGHVDRAAGKPLNRSKGLFFGS